MNEFKVGDIVRCKAECTRYAITNGDMIRGCVEEIDCKKIRIKILEHKDNSIVGEWYVVNSEDFELVESKQIIITYDNDKETVGILRENGKEVKRATAIHSKSEESDFKIRAELVMDRLFEPESYTHELVCVKTSHLFTSGKIYKCDQGKIIDDKGHALACKDDNPYKSLEEINAELGAKFIELVK